MDWTYHPSRPLYRKTALHWTSEGKREKGRSKNIWRRTVKKEILEMGEAWGGIKLMAIDGQMWKENVAAPHAT